MKAKIVAALKTKYPNFGFGDKAFDGVADYLSKTVTEEAQIETAIGGVEGLLKAFQGDTDKVRGEKTALQKELDELKAKGGKPETKDEPEKFTKEYIAQLFAEAVKPFAEKITAFETQTKTEKRNADILAKAKEYGVPEPLVSRFKIGDEEDVDAYMKGLKQDFVNIGFEGTRPPEEGSGAGGGNDIADLISEGTKEIVAQTKK